MVGRLEWKKEEDNEDRVMKGGIENGKAHTFCVGNICLRAIFVSNY